ncbi:MAG: hypothetical protein ACYDEQ_01770 [Desulfocucumaceae bacterium]
MGMDVKRNIVGPVSTLGNPDDEHTWMLMAGAIGSSVEHAVFEQLYGIESVSTEKILCLANQQGIPIYTINRDNINQTLPLISAPANVKQNISDSVLNSGWIAVIPQRGLQVNKWFGYGWQIFDPNSGAAGYLLAGYLTSGNIMETSGGSGTTPVDEQYAINLSLLGILEALSKLFAAVGFMITAYGLYAAEFALVGALASPIFIVGIAMLIIGILSCYILLPAIFGTSNFYRRRWYAIMFNKALPA